MCVREQEGWTALHYACFEEQLTTLLCLIAAGAQLNAKDEVRVSDTCAPHPPHAALPEHASYRFTQNGWTPLHYAAYKGFLPAVTHLLAAGSDVTVLDDVRTSAGVGACVYARCDCPVATRFTFRFCSKQSTRSTQIAPLIPALARAVPLFRSASLLWTEPNKTGTRRLRPCSKHTSMAQPEHV